MFSGYGGLDLAAEAVLGARTVWHAEVDPHAAQVLAHHWPDAPNLGDVTSIDWSTVPPVDVITAGWPCQPFSTAGKRLGTNDPRHLWPHVLDAVRVLRPRYLFGENVAAHLGLGFDRVLADLAAIGFDADWCVVRASDVGACHRRARLFVLAADASSKRLGQHPGGSSRQEGPAWRHSCGGHVAGNPGGERPDPKWGPYHAAVTRWANVTGRPAPDPTIDGRLSPLFVEWMQGLPEGWVTGRGLARTAELKMLGNGVVPQQGAAALEALVRGS
jgi:DNA (cytosine-5)-methyltransferase 1